MCDTYNCDYLKHSTFRFNLIDFQLNTDFPSQFCVFTVKSSSVTQRSVSQENAKKLVLLIFFYILQVTIQYTSSDGIKIIRRTSRADRK